MVRSFDNYRLPQLKSWLIVSCIDPGKFSDFVACHSPVVYVEVDETCFDLGKEPHSVNGGKYGYTADEEEPKKGRLLYQVVA